MAQPILTYSINWGTGNVYQKLSGKTYTNPSGQTVDCSQITVTFSSSVNFKKFYATAVKDGQDYGFIDDILVDIRETNPTGILLHELTSRSANTNFNFTINANQLIAGEGVYRIGLYVQDNNNIWNYEYFLIDSSGNQLVTENGDYLQVPVQNQWEYITSTAVPNNIDPNVYYDLYYIGIDNGYDSSNNNKYFKDGDNYYKTTSTEWNLRETKSGTSSQKVLLGSNIENIVHEIYSGNDSAYLCVGGSSAPIK